MDLIIAHKNYTGYEGLGESLVLIAIAVVLAVGVIIVVIVGMMAERWNYPPAQNPSTRQSMADKEWLSSIGLSMSLLSLCGPLIVCILVVFRIIKVPPDAAWVPLSTLSIGLPASITGLAVSVAARVRYRTWKSIVGINVAILAIPVILFAALLLYMFAYANNMV